MSDDIENIVKQIKLGMRFIFVSNNNPQPSRILGIDKCDGQNWYLVIDKNKVPRLSENYIKNFLMQRYPTLVLYDEIHKYYGATFEWIRINSLEEASQIHKITHK